jgi:hypothetical protein
VGLVGEDNMVKCRFSIVFVLISFALNFTSAASEESLEARAQSIKDTLVVLCLLGGSETTFSAQGDIELRAKIKDLLTGNIGAAAGGNTKFDKHIWEGIIGGISKEMTAVQSQQVSEARKCMVDHGFELMNKVLTTQ